MKVTLIYGTKQSRPSLQKFQFGFKVPVFPPLGLLYLGSSLEQEGHQADIIDFYIDSHPYDAIKKSICSSDAVGISVDNDSFHESSQLAEYIKEQDVDIPIIIGGPHCTLYHEQSLNNIPHADFSVNGDGEQPIVDIVDALQGKKQEKEIPGIYYRKNMIIHQGKPVALIKNLDDIPFPAHHLVNKYPYGKVGNQFFFKPPLTSIVTSRGCPFRCKYCIRYILFSKMSRQRSAENVLNEMHQIYKQGYKSVMIADDTFLTDQQRANKIMDGLIAMGAPMEILIGGTRVDVTDRALYQKMKQAGVKYISFGIESGNQDVLDFYNKQVTLKQIQQAIQLSNDMGFFIHGTFILGAPMEDYTHIKNTISFACSLPLDTVTFNTLAYHYGSDLWKEAYDNNNINGDVYEILADKQHNLSPFTKKELFRLCLWATQRFYYRPNFLAHLLHKAIKNHDARMIKSAIEHVLP